MASAISSGVFSPSANFLETIPIFAGPNAGALSEIAAAVQGMGFRAGDIIVSEGESGNREHRARSFPTASNG